MHEMDEVPVAAVEESETEFVKRITSIVLQNTAYARDKEIYAVGAGSPTA